MISLETLRTLNIRVMNALNSLPAANPLTLAPLDFDTGEDGLVKKTVAAACGGAEPEFQRRIEEEYFAAGPLELLLVDPTVTEIIVNGAESIWCERRGRLERVPDLFLSPLSYRNFIARMSREASIQASLDCPFADGWWRGCRVHLIIPPASGDQAVLTLRRHPTNPWTLEELRKREWATPEAIDALELLVKERRSFLIVGGTGSGKTSVLNACLAATDPLERSVIIEDTSELKVPNATGVKLATRRDPHGHLREIDQSELLKQALRMRPDRIIMGEIRGGEAKDLLMAFATGHAGCMGTLHAESARQALLRLEMLVQLGAPQWSLFAVRTLIWLSVQAVVVVTRGAEGMRKLDGIYSIASLEDIGFLIEKRI